MENNNKDKPVRVRITGCFDQVSAWYRDLIGREYEVTDYLELWYKVRDYQLIYKLDCEVISPEPEKTASEIYSETYAAKSEVLPELSSGILMSGDFKIEDCILPPVNEGEKAGIIEQVAEKYQPLFDVISDILNQHCTESEMDEIIKASQQVIKNFEDEGEVKRFSEQDMKAAFNASRSKHWIGGADFGNEENMALDFEDAEVYLQSLKHKQP